MTDREAAGPLTALLLVAHGSADPAASAAVADLAGAVQARLPKVTVTVGFLDHAEPTAAQALADLGDTPVVVVPLLLADAFHARSDVDELVENACAGGQLVAATDVLGADDHLEDAAVALLDEVGATADTDVVLIAAGTRDFAARAATVAVANRLATRRGGPVQVAYLSAALPTATETLSILALSGQPVAALRWLLFPGRFADAAANAAATAGARCTRLLGAHPWLIEAVVTRYERTVVDSP